MAGAAEITPFLTGVVLGIALSALLEVRAIAVAVAAAAVLFVLRVYFDGGHEALIDEAARIGALAHEGQASGYLAGILVGKMANGVRRSLISGRRLR